MTGNNYYTTRANIFVDAEVQERKHHQESKEFLEQVLRGSDIRICTSIFTLLEITSAIRRQMGRREVYRYLYNIQRKVQRRSSNVVISNKEAYSFRRLNSRLNRNSYY